MLQRLVPVAALIALLAAPVSAFAGLELSEAWVRALPPVQRNTAAYLTLRNAGDSVITVTGGHAAGADRLEIHRSEQVEGTMRMRQVSELTLAPGEQLQLQPGGVHLMLLGLQKMPAEGEQVELCLTLAASDPVCIVAPVQRRAGGADHSHH
ncbi:copper chaperone PCu(A)C [Parahaliea maris]|uniref:Copper chaperone PCu(A)C n=1 Tax=Parahaliea maris TaxID=2716870 RepID=A0A5C8ZNQ9_9GAMM|nr:copper chaperone PCu(A)C [Parahaliea maris]TXS89001.1 copper chaperone PCu(A)C [Parahaliea maris]